ncbi:TPA: hypothetical protein ACH3X2_014042 [Trebouxia sp. C0005]|nr:MAG: hypothetical protein FRX49_06151 [Trebouxia sp. A1-2]
MGEPATAKRCARPGHINTLPDELLSQVLRLLPFATKAAFHSVSKRWNRILRHPLIPQLWQDIELDLTASSLTTQRERELWRIADWLARRASGIQLLLINSGPWRNANVADHTESGCFYKQQLPYLMGQLRHKGVQLKLSFWSTDLDLLVDPLLSDALLKSYLRDNLLELSLKKYHDNAMAQGSLDGLSNLSSLQTLHIRPLHMGDTWEVTAKLSQLTALRSFHFQRGILKGKLIAALGSLPALTELKSSCMPDANFTVDSSQFTALRSFTKSSNALYDSAPAPFVLQFLPIASQTMLTRGQSLGMLRKLSLHDCILTTAPPSLRSLSCLKKIKFKNCRFRPELWLEDALQGATQIERMTIVDCKLKAVPASLCHLYRLKNLTLADNDLHQLPCEFSQLTSLKFLGLYNNEWTFVPEVLEHMVHLQEISLAYSADSMQVKRPLTFLLNFHSLLAFNIAQGSSTFKYTWDSTSMYYIGEMIAAMESTFQGTCKRRPEFLW